MSRCPIGSYENKRCEGTLEYNYKRYPDSTYSQPYPIYRVINPDYDQIGRAHV